MLITSRVRQDMCATLQPVSDFIGKHSQKPSAISLTAYDKSFKSIFRCNSAIRHAVTKLLPVTRTPATLSKNYST